MEGKAIQRIITLTIGRAALALPRGSASAARLIAEILWAIVDRGRDLEWKLRSPLSLIDKTDQLINLFRVSFYNIVYSSDAVDYRCCFFFELQF